MSYDIFLFTPVPGEDWRDTAQRDINFDAPMTLEARERNAKAVAALKSFNTDLEVTQLSDGVQLTAIDGTGIAIELNLDTGAMSVPSWRKDAVENITRLVGQYLKIVHETTGFLAYDRQTETLIDPKLGFTPAAQTSSSGTNPLQETSKKSWWKVW